MSFAFPRVVLLLLLTQARSPLVDYHAREALKEKLAGLVVEIKVTLGVPAGADDQISPQLVGQGVCLADGRVLTSGFLVDNAASIEIRGHAPEAKVDEADWRSTTYYRSSAVVHDPTRWFPAGIALQDEELGIALLKPAAGSGFACRSTEFAGPELVGPETLVFSVDNPVGSTSIFWGMTERWGETPLTSYLLTGSGLPLGGPLFSVAGRLVALNLRHYAPGSKLFLAATAVQLHRSLRVKRNLIHTEIRRSRRGPE